MTAAQLAEKCSVAPSAIIRFCKSIGLSGFSELKIRLAQESVSREKTDELPSPPSGEGAEGVARRVFHSGMQTLKNTMDMRKSWKKWRIRCPLPSAFSFSA